MTLETASYFKGKRYLLLKGNRENNLKQSLPSGNFCPKVSTAKTLAEQYKDGEHTIKVMLNSLHY